MRPIRVIAEIGENHAGDWTLARSMLAAAAGAGADFVKFQSYQAADVADTDPEKAWFARVSVPDAVHHDLLVAAAGLGVQFLSAPFSLDRARLLCEGLGLKVIKIASSEMLNLSLLRYVNRHADEVFLSTGMATLEEIKTAVGELADVPSVVILHCVTQYPVAPPDANLGAIRALKSAFPGHEIGYSDHTIGMLAPLLAVALGATVIEKHFTVDRSLDGTDHELSLLPEEFARMVRDIRAAEVMLGAETKAPCQAELEIRELVRSRFPK